MINLLVFSLALFGSYYTHAALPSDPRHARAPESTADLDPRQDECMTEEEKAATATLLIAFGKKPESVTAAIEEFDRLCRPRGE